ncbi:MAG: S1C family serine protease [Bacillota bacterium]
MAPEESGSAQSRGVRRPRSTGRAWMMGGVGLLLGAALVWGAGPGADAVRQAIHLENLARLAETARADAAGILPQDMTAEERNVVAVVEVASPGVVQILVDAPTATHPAGGQSSGSGFVWDTDGHIVTNNHVVEEGGRITAVFHGGSQVEARVVGADHLTDLAVLEVKVPKSALAPLPLADSDKVRVGQKAIAIGSPLGIGEVSDEFGLDGEPTVTEGIVSAKDRTLPIQQNGVTEFRIRRLIQTDAAINPGNSGGPLLNSRAEVIGVNTAIIPTARGIGFAIPSNVVSRVVPQLIAEGKVERPQLGIEFVSLERVRKDLRDAFDELGFPTDHGALVTAVVPGSGAAEAGIRGSTGTQLVAGYGPVPVGGDIIVAVDGRAIAGDDLPEAVLGYSVGERITLTLYRNGQKMDVEVTLSRR